MEKKKFKLTKEGYDKLNEELLTLISEYNDNEKRMSMSFQSAVGDGAHDNGDFEALQQDEKLLVSRIRFIKERLENAEIIEKPVLDEDQINIDDDVLLRIYYDVDDIEEETFRLVGTDGDILDRSISINSPIGQAIFMRKVNERVSYYVNNRKIDVDILEKIKGLKK